MAISLSPPDPVTISWSSLKRWENCPQHQLRVITKQVEKSNKGRIFLPGTLCDLTQRRWLESANPQPGEMADMIEMIFNEIVEEREHKIFWRDDPAKDKESVKEQCREAVNTLEPWLMEHVLPFDYAPEVKFKAHMEVPYICEGVSAPIKMIGGIDIVVRDDIGKFHLYDLKITKDGGYIRSTLAQLIFYDLAWGVIQGDFEHAVEWGFVTPSLEEKFIPIEVDVDSRRQMLSRVVKYAQGVWADEWSPKADDTGCSWCEARDHCEKFKMIPIVDENGKQKMSFAQAAEQRAQFRTQTSTVDHAGND